MIKKYLAIFLASFLIFSNVLQAEAYSAGRGYKYVDQGGIFTLSTVPVDAAKAENGDIDIDLTKLKSGESTAKNFFFLVEVGNASIQKAAQNGGITNVKYVDSRTCKVLVPVLFIPILVRKTTTIVYGE